MSSEQVIINRDRIFKKLRFNDGSEAYKNADRIFDELSSLIQENIRLTTLYRVTDSDVFNVEEINGFEKYAICLVSSDDKISEISNEMMSSGEYLKGYLLHEIATDVIFAASDALNKEMETEAAKMGYRICGNYAPGDGKIDLAMHGVLLDKLKREAEIKVYVSSEHILIPGKSLLYVLGLKQMQDTDGLEEYCACGQCGNSDCDYRKE